MPKTTGTLKGLLYPAIRAFDPCRVGWHAGDASSVGGPGAPGAAPKLAHTYYISALRAGDFVLQAEAPVWCGLGFSRTRRLQLYPGASTEVWVTTSRQEGG